MSRITIPTESEAPEASKPLLQAVHKQIGMVPNLMKVLSHAPAALEGYLALSGSLGKGALDAKIQESLAIEVAELNGCDYCLAAHSYIGQQRAKLTSRDVSQARQGHSTDPRVEAALQFARRVVTERGLVADADLHALRKAGFNDGEALEIVVQVALNTLTNYVNNVAQTEVDFPRLAGDAVA